MYGIYPTIKTIEFMLHFHSQNNCATKGSFFVKVALRKRRLNVHLFDCLPVS